MRVFLIHGMGRTRLSLSLLATRLRRAGHAPSTFGYLVHRDSLERIVDDFVGHVERTVADVDGDVDDAGYAIIGHSLGNVITRLASPRLPGLRAFVMLAPPNQPPAMARVFSPSPIFQALTGDAGKKLVDAEFYARLPVPPVRTLIVAGTTGPRGRWTPWQGQKTDGVVGVEETRLPGVPVVELPAFHTFIMNDAAVFSVVRRFLAGEGDLETAQRAG